MEDIFRLAVKFLTGQHTNRIAQAFVGIMVLVLGVKFVVIVLETVPPLNSESAGRRTLRGAGARP